MGFIAPSGHPSVRLGCAAGRSRGSIITDTTVVVPVIVPADSAVTGSRFKQENPLLKLQLRPEHGRVYEHLQSGATRHKDETQVAESD